MLDKFVISLCTISIVMKSSLTQYYANQFYQNMPPQNYYHRQQPEPEIIDYEEPMESENIRRYGPPKTFGRGPTLTRSEKDEDDYDPSADYEDCKCSCSRCRTFPQKPCCAEVCQTCEEMRQSQQIEPQVHPQQLQQGQGSVLFVPYPYPLMLPNNIVKSEVKTTTAAPTTAETKSTSIDFRKKDDTDSHGKTQMMMKDEKRYMLTTVRKTRPAWEPKYGIVPIPDTLAEKLMNQLKQEHSRKM